jgi:nucleoside-diphosphate-sugar epimerase
MSKLRPQLVGVNAIVHLGGLAHNMDGSYNLEDYVAANTSNTLSLAKASRDAKLNRFIFISSIAVNGSDTNDRHPFIEEDIPNPVTYYGQSKRMAEDVIKDIFKNSSTDFVILRPPLIYGPNCPGNFQTLLRLVSIFRILPFGALEERKSMLYIENFLDAIFCALRSSGAANQIFILGDSEVLTLKEIIDILMAEFHGINMLNLPIKPSVLKLLVRIIGKQEHWQKFTAQLEVNPDKFYRMTNWQPPYNAREGLKQTAKRI